MNVNAVEATTLATVAYEARAMLRLEFLSQAIYQYFGVPRPFTRAYCARPLRAVTSIGSFVDASLLLPTSSGETGRGHESVVPERSR